jgi:predicted nuclease of predicted toxin-antitoxin system
VKLLLDENLSHKLVARLSEAFPGTVHVDAVGLHGQPDAVIWDYAGQHGFVLVSKDDDFRQLSFLRGHPPKVIWLLVGNAGTAAIADLLLQSRDSMAAFAERAEEALLTLGYGVTDAP